MIKTIWGMARWAIGAGLGSFGFGALLPSSGLVMGLLALAVPAAGLGTAAYYSVKSAAQVKAAIIETEAFEKAACSAQIADIRQSILDDTQDKIEAAEQAADEVEPLPETDAELLALCRRSASCRNRLSLLEGEPIE